jgi:hypothetical protein
MEMKVVKEKAEEIENKSNQVHYRSRHFVKCLWYNSTFERFSEEIIPIEVLKFIPPANDVIIAELRSCISLNKIVRYVNEKGTHLIRPKSITARSGYYFFKGYDYVTNTVAEIPIQSNDSADILDSPFLDAAPKFDIDKNPHSGSSEFISNEIKELISIARKQNNYVRIKYKNRNDEISIRTIKEYNVVEGMESDGKHIYLIGFCMLRQAKRVFKISRIQNIQQLAIGYSSPGVDVTSVPH